MRSWSPIPTAWPSGTARVVAESVIVPSRAPTAVSVFPRPHRPAMDTPRCQVDPTSNDELVDRSSWTLVYGGPLFAGSRNTSAASTVVPPTVRVVIEIRGWSSSQNRHGWWGLPWLGQGK